MARKKSGYVMIGCRIPGRIMVTNARKDEQRLNFGGKSRIHGDAYNTSGI